MKKTDRLQRQIDDIMQRVYGQEQKISTAFYESFAKQAYYRSVFEVQKNTGVNFQFEHVSNKKADFQSAFHELVRETLFREDMEKHGGAGKRVKNRITGKPDYRKDGRETAEVIEQKFACGAKNARRLIRTESSFLHGELAAISYLGMCGSKNTSSLLRWI